MQPRERSLLDQITADNPSHDAASKGPVATDDQLEKQFEVIDENQRQLDALKSRAIAAASSKKEASFKDDVEKGKPLTSLLNLRLSAFEKDLASARASRPSDPIVQWLTGELLIMVGGEPETVLPYLKRAVEGGLKRARTFASMAKVEFDLNRFQSAYDDASHALDLDSDDPQIWETYGRASYALQRFDSLIERLARAFPEKPPSWVRPMTQAAAQSQKRWLHEQALRREEDRRGDLPLVRLIVEHRKFAQPGAGSGIVPGGRGTVVIALFEDQAPSTVANFIHLVETGFYSGTSFYWAEAGHMVVGGDPNTKNDDPSDDGTGGPGYTIPDEFASPNARGHFRGTISTVQNAPRNAGSQFFITLVPAPEFDGNSTAFGRVIQGQEVLDQVTEGRTNREVGEFGKIIPGDQIVRAEVRSQTAASISGHQDYALANFTEPR